MVIDSHETPTTVLEVPLPVSARIDGVTIDAAIVETKGRTSLVEWLPADGGPPRSRWLDNDDITPTTRG
jgi:hypothetical protein